ncbi:MAG: Secretion protein HlyD [Verrucomicrobiales bacterium]|nr:Secretion protein HlyD [Verrucomicrobiales bacterium]
MDRPVSPTIRRARQKHRWLIASAAAVVLVLATLGLGRLQPAIPRVDKASLYLGTVQRGEMLRQVRGNGSLIPERIQFVQAETAGRVERIFVQAGEMVDTNTALMDLSNPELEQESFDAEWLLKGAEAQLKNLRAKLEDNSLALKSSIAALDADASQAQADSRMNDALAKDRLISEIERQRSQTKAQGLNQRLEIERDRLKSCASSTDSQLAVQQAEVERARALLKRKQQQVAALHVRAGVSGVLQQIGDIELLQSGQRVMPGVTLAKIVEPGRLKAILKIPETQVRDVQIGQKAEIDTRNGVVSGIVTRIDPAAQNGTVTVDVKLNGALPKGARPDLSVDGVIELERLESVLYVGLPVQGHADATVPLFKLEPDGKAAHRVPVKLGRSSVNTIEILQGLQTGDQVILSDMSQWDTHERLRVD